MAKTCTKCGVEKIYEDFHRNKNSRDGLTHKCKACAAADTRRWVAENRDRKHEADHRYWHENRKGSRSDENARLKYKYGVTLEDVERMFTEQGGLCAICRTPMIGRKPHVDHDHLTGTVRGLLCRGCNQGLGHFRDDPVALANAIRYLEHYA